MHKIFTRRKEGKFYALTIAETGRIISTTTNESMAPLFSDEVFYKVNYFSDRKKLRLNLNQE